MTQPHDQDASARLAQVREILFGKQAQDFDTRISTLQKQLTDSIASLGVLLQERSDALERRVRQETGDLRSQLQAQMERHHQVQAETSQQLAELRQQLVAQQEAMQGQFQQDLAHLKRESVSRRSLSSALRALSERLEQDEVS